MTDHPFMAQPGCNVCICGEPHIAHRDYAVVVARNIVNQLFDAAEVPVAKRQEINDLCDSWVATIIGNLLWNSDGSAGSATPTGDNDG